MFDFGRPRDERTPLVQQQSSGSDANNPTYYFVGKASNSYQGGTTAAVRDNDGGVTVEEFPEGADEEEFAPRVIGSPRTRPAKSTMNGSEGSNRNNNGSGSSSFWSNWFSSPPPPPPRPGQVGSLLKVRKAPVKIEPKVFFANERTFLAWMHLSVVLAGASIAILAFVEDSNLWGQLYGVALLPVAISFIVYSMYQYQRRATMIRHRHPGPYEDSTGPVVLGVMLMISIVVQFALKLYSLSYSQ